MKKNCTTGKHILNGKIRCLKLDGEKRVEYLRIDLTDIMVKSNIKWEWGGQTRGPVMKEDVELVFAEFHHEEYLLLTVMLVTPCYLSLFGFNIQTSRVSG